MSDNDRKNLREMEEDHEHHDTLERLTRIFNLGRQNKNQNDSSSLQDDQSVSHTPKASPDDDFDLSFLEAEFENNLTNDLPFDNQKKQRDSHVDHNEPTSNVAQTSSYNHKEKESFLSESAKSSPVSHDEEQILDALSPLPIKKNQSYRNRTASVRDDPFSKKSDFNAQSESYFFDEIDRQNNHGVSTKRVEPDSHFSQQSAQQSNTPNVQQDYGDNQNLHDPFTEHTYKVSAHQEKRAKKYYTDVSLTSPNDSVFFSSSAPTSEQKRIKENETANDSSQFLHSMQGNEQPDLNDLPEEDYTTDYPQFYEKKPLHQDVDAENTQKHYDTQTQYSHDADRTSAEQSNKKEGPYNQNNLDDIYPSSKPPSTKPTESFPTHNYTNRNTLPPNVDTYNFSEAIVEKTGPIMVPEVPYETPEYDIPTDDLKEEFADVLSVGNISKENLSQQQQQDQAFNEIFHQTMQESRIDTSRNFQDQNTSHISADNIGHYPSSLSEGPLYRDTDQSPLQTVSTSFFKSFIGGRTFVTSIVLLVLIASGFIGYFHFFMPSQKNGTTPIIYADEKPFKFKQETAKTKNDIAHNLDIYKQTTEQNDKQENTQKFLIDNSEQPENLAEISQQESTNSSSSFFDEFDVENAVTKAINHTIPTREVQTVVVNQDGSILLAPKHDIEETTTDKPEEIIDHNTVDQIQDFSPVSSHEAYVKDKEGEEDTFTNEIDKIIAENDSSSHIEEKAIPLPLPAERSVEPQAYTASHPTQSNQVTTQNSENYYVQLASQPTHTLARDSLKKMKSRFASLIGVRPVDIQSALIPGKGTYYRVRVQTQNRDEAINLCENIKVSGGDCFITR
ncbi:hypothetical protein ABID23_001245 [Bartonella silvatica]|uniref:SPOR domain-containing protein n=1 Tax=Bartonella silvatica TaxID=357760 RepID=A0ABV2HHV5_9HYPH